MTDTVFYRRYPAPIGELLLVAEREALTGLFMTGHSGETTPAAHWKRDDSLSVFRKTCEQLDAYFAGEQTDFDLPLDLAGTAFQQRVWSELRQIPYGETISYAELAQRIQQPGAARAVGNANGRNRISIIIPCHRVIAADGTLGGYGGGLDRKRWLLEHEAAVLGRRRNS